MRYAGLYFILFCSISFAQIGPPSFGAPSGTGAAVVNSGTFALASGTASNCVLVNGTSAPCDAPGQGAVGNVTPVTVSANSTSPQVLQQLSLTAGLLNVAGNSGGAYTYNGSGIYTVASLQVPTLTWTLNLCTVSGCGSGTVRALATIVTPAVVTATNNAWNIRLAISNTGTGVAGTLITHGSAIVELTAASDTGTASSDSNTTSSGAIDLTAALFLQLTVTTSTGNAGNSITEDHSSLEPASATGATSANVRARAIGYAFDGGGSALTSGVTKYLPVPFACTISHWTMIVDTGTATVKLWKVNGATPTVSNVISTSGFSISSGTYAGGASSSVSDLSTVSVAAYDSLGFNLYAVSSTTQAILILECDQ